MRCAPGGILCRVDTDQLRRGSALREQLAHIPHRLVDVMEEGQVSVAKVVEPGLTVGGPDEAVLGAAAVAGEAHVALPALAGELVALVISELLLARGGEQLHQRCLYDVAEPVAGLDEVIT